MWTPSLGASCPVIVLAACVASCGGGNNSPSSPSPSVPPTVQIASGPIDPERIPVGDGKLTTAGPRVGYLFVCAIPSSPNGPGRAPWIGADGTWDSTAKIAVQGSASWNSQFSVTALGSLLSIMGNGLPSHPTGVFPIARGSDPAFAYDANPNAIAAVAIAFGLPANPQVSARPTCTMLGAIGVLLTGARLYNASDADGRDAVAHEVQDSCDGHPQGAGMYHYHNVSRCIAQPSSAAHSPLVGYAADGFGLYGNLGELGLPLTNADLDECHGHTHAVALNGSVINQYHYHGTREFPYTIGCFKGTPVNLR